MTLRLTPEMLARCYDFVCSTQPFDKWNMPDSDDIRFFVVKTPTLRGFYRRDANGHSISISKNVIGHSPSLVAVMAHEMIHLHQAILGWETPGAQHNAAFNRLAASVCKYHGFDPKLF